MVLHPLSCARCAPSPQNLIAQSQSGTGKTAAFVLAMLSRVEPGNKYPQVISAVWLSRGVSHPGRAVPSSEEPELLEAFRCKFMA